MGDEIFWGKHFVKYYKWNNKKWIVVKVFTKLDGESASKKLDLLEDKLFEKYQDDFLDNILLSMEFE